MMDDMMNDLDPSIVDAMFKAGALGPQMEAARRQQAMADLMRTGAVGHQSRTGFGALAQGLMGYGANKQGAAAQESMQNIAGQTQDANRQYLNYLLSRLRGGGPNPAMGGAPEISDTGYEFGGG